MEKKLRYTAKLTVVSIFGVFLYGGAGFTAETYSFKARWTSISGGGGGYVTGLWSSKKKVYATTDS